MFIYNLGAAALRFDSDNGVTTLSATLSISTHYVDANITLAYASNATGGCEARIAVCNASTNGSTHVNATEGCPSACASEIFNPVCNKFVGGRGTGTLLVKNVGSRNITFFVDYAHDTYVSIFLIV